MASVEQFQEKFGTLKEVDKGKDQLIEDLIARVKELEVNLKDNKSHIQREQELAKLYQSRMDDAQDEIKQTNEKINSNSFVSVLIDGDHMLFLDAIVTSGQSGGMDAVRLLKEKVSGYLSTELKISSHIPVRVRIYAGTRGLASTYRSHGILDSADDLDKFVRGVNMGDPMCDFVDAGNGKECADSKLKAWFEHNMADSQCRAVVFGGSGDGGYATVLRPYRKDDPKSSRIVLIEGPPFARELAIIQDKFLVARFPDVFRTTKLASPRASFSTTLPPTQVPTPPSYASAVTASTSTAAVRSDNTIHHSATGSAARSTAVLVNSLGQRIDSVINPIPKLVDALRGRKQCNAFHILGYCPYDNCNFLHGVRLDRNGIEARRWIARQSRCTAGFQCRDENCLSGHECPERVCSKIDNGCWFPRQMHNVDRA